MALQRLALVHFAPGSRERGQELFERGHVHVRKRTPSTFGEFSVKGTVLYNVYVGLSLTGEFELECSCAHFKDGHLCKHLWASILQADAIDLFPGLTEVDHIDVVRGRKSAISKGNSRFTALPRGDVGGDSDLSKSPHLLSAWRNHIQRAEKRVAQKEPRNFDSYRAKTSSNEKTAHFVVDVSAAAQNGQIRIYFFVQERLKNGSLGAIKPADLNHKSIPHFTEPQDRAILLNLLGKTELAGNYYSASEKGSSSATIPAEFAGEILEQISATGRFYMNRQDPRYFHYVRNSRFELEPYSYVNETWEYRLKLERTGKSFLLSGRLTDGSRTKGADEIVAQAGPFLFFKDFMARSNFAPRLIWLAVFEREQSLSIPEAEVDGFLEYFFSTGTAVQLDLPQELEFKEETSVEPTVRITIAQREESPLLQARPEFNYGGECQAFDSLSPVIVDVAKRRMIRRNSVQEALLREQFLNLHPALSRPGFLGDSDVLEIMEAALGVGWEVVAHRRTVRRPKDFNIRVTSGVDWFDLNGDFNFDGFTEHLPALISALKSGQRLVRLGDGSYGMLPLEWIRKFAPVAEIARATESGLRLNKIQALFMNASLEENDKFRADAKFASLKTIINDFQEQQPLSPPDEFNGRLRQYQKVGLSWLVTLAKHEIGGVLADDMGLGKTIQILALLLHAKRQENAATKIPSLIVAPLSLIFNWIKEAEKFAPTLKILNFTGVGRHEDAASFDEYDVVLTTYQTLRNDIELLKERKFQFFILDEAHFIKNPEAQASMACRLIQANKKLSLTGTPVENSLGDLFSILSVVNPGLISDSQASQWAKTTDPEELKTLSRALRPFILRRTKEQVLKDLPERSEQILYCELSPREKRKYTELKAFYWNNLSGKLKEKGLARSKIEILEALLRLRQAACHQGLLDSAEQGTSSAKFDLLFDQLDTVIKDGHKALIFSQFTSLLELLSNRLHEKGISFEYLDGKTTNRAERVERFQTDPEIKLFLLSLKAGGVGLNLTAADYVYVLDPWWNPAAESQAIDRAHRIGQKRKVFAYKIIAKDTVEEKILELQESKRALAKAVISQETSILKNLKMEDLQALFL